MKIVVCHNDYQQNGGESEVVEREIALLRAHGISVVEYRVSNKQILSYNKIEKMIFFFRTIFNINSYLHLSRLIRHHSPNLVHVHNVFPLLSPSIYYACFKNKIPVVQTIHNFRFFCPNGLFYTHGKVCELCKNGNYWHSIRLKCFRESYILTSLYGLTIWFYRKIGLLKKISIFIVLTEFAKEKFLTLGVKEAQIVVKPNFVPGRIEITPQGLYGLYIGRLSKEKGILTLLEALDNYIGPTLFKIAGVGELANVVENFAKQNPAKVQYLGYMSGNNKVELLRNAKFIVVPSECYENMPVSILEAFKFGKPVIASRIGSIPFIVQHKVTGILFQPGNAKQLTNSIEILENDFYLLNKMAMNTRNVFDEKFSSETQINQIKSIYTSVSHKIK